MRPYLLIAVGLLCIAPSFIKGGFGPPSQRERAFDNACNNCTVSNGLGFMSSFSYCNCYFTCVFFGAEKLASYANPWVSYLRCCPCDMTFSRKLLTCVDYTDKRSDCFNENKDNNPCVAAETRLIAPDPDDFGGFLCSGFLSCDTVGGVLVPRPMCCPADTCFVDATETCGSCASCPKRDSNDCSCDDTPAPIRECGFVSVSSSIFQFMGRENMKTYDCAPGTCWDQNLCTCVRTNNTGYNECVPFVELDFNNNEFTATDNLGSPIYTTISDSLVTVTEEAAQFSGGNITVSGISNVWLSNRFSLHFDFTLEDTTTLDVTECFIGTCNNNEENGTFTITVENEESETDDMNVYMTYKDREYWIPGSETTETVFLELDGDYDTDIAYEFWLFYGWNEQVMAGVIDGGGSLVSVAYQEVTGSVMLVNPASGLVLGECGYGGGLSGELDNVELVRNCEEIPGVVNEFTEAYDLVLAPSLSGPG